MCEQKQSFANEIEYFLSRVSGEKVDIAAQIYFMLEKEENAGQKLQYFLAATNEIESSEEEPVEQHFLPKQIGELREKCDDLIRGVLGKLIKENMDEKDFYDALWEKGIRNNPLFEQEDEKIYALYCVWMDRRIPYYKLDMGIKMPNEEYKEITVKNEARIRKAVFVINSDFSQKTERASLLNKILDESKSESEKAVILAQILDAMIQKVVEGLLNRTSDEEDM